MFMWLDIGVQWVKSQVGLSALLLQAVTNFGHVPPHAPSQPAESQPVLSPEQEARDMDPFFKVGPPSNLILSQDQLALCSPCLFCAM